jgi:lipase chaperone LimK
MTTDPKKAMKNLAKEIESDLGSFTDDFLKNLREQTPVQSGRAKRGWRKGQKTKADGQDSTMITNRVPYISELDKGTSRQAPDGIVQPAFKKTIRKYK